MNYCLFYIFFKYYLIFSLINYFSKFIDKFYLNSFSKLSKKFLHIIYFSELVVACFWFK